VEHQEVHPPFGGPRGFEVREVVVDEELVREAALQGLVERTKLRADLIPKLAIESAGAGGRLAA
jgi:hypothetical protein